MQERQEQKSREGVTKVRKKQENREHGKEGRKEESAVGRVSCIALFVQMH